jgi:uncharacterized protein involved in exopolysaccharide biosynthesis
MQDANAPVADEPISLGDISRLLWRARYFFVVGALLGAGAGIGLSFVMTPIYRGEAVVVPLDPVDGGSMLSGLSSQLGDLAALAGVGNNSGDFRREALAYLRSRAIVDKLITDQNLLTTILRCDPVKNASSCKLTKNDAIRRFRTSVLNISEDRRSGLVTVAAEWRDPVRAAAWANELVHMANEELRRRTMKEAEATQQYLSSQVEKIPTVEVRAAVYRLIEAQLKTTSVASSRPDYAFRVIDAAAVPDLDDEVRPNKPLMAVVGFMLGAALAFIVFLVRTARRRATPGSAGAG